jgi:hypothetical protein
VCLPALDIADRMLTRPFLVMSGARSKTVVMLVVFALEQARGLHTGCRGRPGLRQYALRDYPPFSLRLFQSG